MNETGAFASELTRKCRHIINYYQKIKVYPQSVRRKHKPLGKKSVDKNRSWKQISDECNTVSHIHSFQLFVLENAKSFNKHPTDYDPGKGELSVAREDNCIGKLNGGRQVCW